MATPFDFLNTDPAGMGVNIMPTLPAPGQDPGISPFQANTLVPPGPPSIAEESIPPGPQFGQAYTPPTIQAPGPDPMGVYANAIATIESSGRYDLIGPRHPTLGRALGRYQIMESNLQTWLREAGLQGMSPEQFLANPQAQDTVFRHRFGLYLRQFGNPVDASQAWFAGPGSVGAPGAENRRDSLGTTVAEYRRRFESLLGGSAPMALGGPSGRTTPQSAPIPMNTGNQPLTMMERFFDSITGSQRPEIAQGFWDVLRGVPTGSQINQRRQNATAEVFVRGQQLRLENPGAPIQQLATMMIRDPVWGRNVLLLGGTAPQVLQQSLVDPFAPVSQPHLPHDAMALQRDPVTGQISPVIGPDGQPIIGPTTRQDPRTGRGTEILERTANQRANVNRLRADFALLRQMSDRIPDSGAPTGQFTNVLRNWAARWGLPVANMNEYQLVESIVQRVAPTFRVEGSGSTSNVELEGMLRSLPTAGQTVQGRRMIIAQLDAIAEHIQRRAEIAEWFWAGEPSNPNDPNSPRVGRTQAEIFQRLQAEDRRFEQQMAQMRQRMTGSTSIPSVTVPGGTLTPLN